MFDKSKAGVKKAISETKETKGHRPEGRPERIGLSQTSNLSIPKGIQRKDYAYQFIKDKPERIEAFEAAWWEPVKDGEGKLVKKAAGGGEYLLLYRTRREYYEEDVKEMQKKPINLLKNTAKLDKGNKYSGEYVPEGSDAVVVINN